MAVERGTKAVTKVVRLLTDPIPQLVSLVEHGANQTPFKVVKHAQIERDLQEDAPMAGLRTRSVKDAGKADIHKMAFKAEHFTDEAAVKKYLDDNAYTNFAITKTAAGDFEVAGHAADQFDGDIKMIVAQKGLTMHVGKLKAGAGEAAAEGTTKGATAKTETGKDGKTAVAKSSFDVKGVPAHEVAHKWSGWMAQYSDATTLKEALDAGADGLPPGIYEVNCAFYAALTNVLSGEGDTAGAVTALCGELATVINALQAVFATVSEEATRAAVTKAATRITVTVTDDAHSKKDDAVKTEAEKAAEAAAAEAAKKAKATAEDGAGKVTAETGEGKDGKGKKEGEGSEGDGGKAGDKEGAKKDAGKTDGAAGEQSDVTKAITDALSPITAAIAKIGETVAGLQEASTKAATEQASANATLSESVTKAVERLDAIDKDRSQTRKSAELEGARGGTQEPPRHTVSRMSRNVLGMRRRD